MNEMLEACWDELRLIKEAEEEAEMPRTPMGPKVKQFLKDMAVIVPAYGLGAGLGSLGTRAATRGMSASGLKPWQAGILSHLPQAMGVASSLAASRLLQGSFNDQELAARRAMEQRGQAKRND